MRLFSLGYREHQVIKPAIEWLKLHWKDWDKDNPVLDESLYKRCYEYTQDWIPRLNSQPLTWLLDALHGAGFSMEDPLIIKGIARLKSLQNEQGIWPDPEYSTVEATVTALRLLRDYVSP